MTDTEPSREDVAADWLIGQRAARTERTYRPIIDEWFDWCDSNGVDVFTARRRDGDAWRRHLADVRGLGPASVTKYLAGLSSFYTYAAQETSLIDYSPIAMVKRPMRTTEPRRPSLTAAEGRAVLAASIADGPRAAALVHLLLATGVRVSEAVGADVADLGGHGDERTLAVTRKGGKRAAVRIGPMFWPVIAAYLDDRDEGPVFLTKRGRMSPSLAWSIVSTIAATVVPAKRIGPHSLRRTAATLALDAGQPMQEVQQMLGHASPAMTQIYDTARLGRGRAASAAVESVLMGDA